ncbi:hypothetical protein ACJZ2D_005543 [Fusarium nematophilum]
MMERHPSTRDKYARPAAELDRLFVASYDHVEGSNDGSATLCDRCDVSQLVQRLTRPNKHCKIHYGKVAPGNQVMTHGETQDRLAHELGAICFEMEAAGLVDANLACLVVRGIGDYADSHKNNQWRGYAAAAAAAAAYTKELLSIIPTVMSKGLLSMRRPWKSPRGLPNPSLVFSSSLLQSITKNEAQLRHLLAREHDMTRLVLLKELRTAQLTLNDASRIAMCTLPADKTSPSVTDQGPLSEDAPRDPNLGRNLPSKMCETDSTESELPPNGSQEVKANQSQLSRAVENLDRLGKMIQMYAKDMKVVSASFRHDRNRGEESDAEDDRPTSKRCCESKPEAPVTSQTGSSTLAKLGSREYAAEGSSNVDSTATESTDPTATQSTSQDGKGIDRIMTDDTTSVEVTREFFSHSPSLETLPSYVACYVQEEGHT